jgi:tetratricopeptide (TPR) repeat protein
MRHRPWMPLALTVAGLTASGSPVHTEVGTVSSSQAAGNPSAPGPLVFVHLPEGVRQAFERAYQHARAHPTDAAAVGQLGMLLHAHDQYGPAAASYRTARALAPKSLSWAYFLGVVQGELGDHAGAVRSFRAALTIDQGCLQARLRLADILTAAGDLGASRDEYQALVRDFPELAIAHYGLGRLSAVTGDARAAAAHYQRAIDIAPQFGAAHYALGLAYRDLGRDDRSESHVQAFRRWGARRPVPPDPLMVEVQSLRATGRHLLEDAARLGSNGRIEESISLHLKAIEADPTAAQAHVNLISLYGRLERLDQAEQHYRAALTLKSSLADAHYNYGVLLASSRRHREAADAFRLALEVNPFHAQAHNNLATLLAAQGNLDDAASHYRQAVANDPGHRAARFNLGRALVALGRARDATEQFERLLEPQNPEATRYTHALANAWLAAGDIAKAREYATRALRDARAFGQTTLAASIEHDLQTMTARSK